MSYVSSQSPISHIASYPLVNVYLTMERSTIFNSFLYVYQSVIAYFMTTIAQGALLAQTICLGHNQGICSIIHYIPSGNLTLLLKMAIYSGFTH